jgi:hypothetical protein
MTKRAVESPVVERYKANGNVSLAHEQDDTDTLGGEEEEEEIGSELEDIFKDTSDEDMSIESNFDSDKDSMEHEQSTENFIMNVEETSENVHLSSAVKGSETQKEMHKKLPQKASRVRRVRSID